MVTLFPVAPSPVRKPISFVILFPLLLVFLLYFLIQTARPAVAPYQKTVPNCMSEINS
jgi:hypothetical protein